ncbi:aconitate hydratase AcnA [Acuticoccus sediminis]|uniref:Aconitate hydratase A n=1 Tax=Acuticoccus sediminis TaxID=2184697 RepID=A0A8B2P082_9HYPH|nr:aconitate hydratase AcnA [Acuticoccus sediminis]RAI04481.1 aconitate hydratase AcnA [Acuticoccus sediminis]
MSETTVQFGPSSVRAIDLRVLLGARLQRLPHVVRLLAENHVRSTRDADPLLAALDAWLAGHKDDFELVFRPNRLLMHDTTCTPALADIAGLRDTVAEAGGDPATLAPQLPVEVSVDHSVAVDRHAVPGAAATNMDNEIARNTERYAFMKWASQSLSGVHVNPPGTGIMHTLNLEQLATVVVLTPDGTAHPDMLLGTDSHTPMVNGIGVLAWGVGGLEAESVMFGQPASLAMPSVVGVRLTGALRPGALATDLALEVTHRLRVLGVTGDFVEFFGPGVATLSADERAVVANMAPEYGASTGFFPVDGETVAYLVRTGRPPALTDAVEPVLRAMGLWFEPDAHPRFDREITIDLSALGPLLAGPRRPQDRIVPAEAAASVEAAIGRPLAPAAAGEVPDGAVGIAAITSCTNTSDPRLLIAAGLLARNARARGLSAAPWVKTSLAPGSPSARSLLDRADLADDLAALGFEIVGFGCTTCIGNSGPLPDIIEEALANGRAVAAVLSGNRNFPGRVHPKLDLGFLASPPLVIAYAIRGTIHGDILDDPLGQDPSGAPVRLRDLWPTPGEIDAAMAAGFRAADVPADFAAAAASAPWQAIPAPRSPRFPWDPASRNLRRPKFAGPSETRLGRYDAQALMVLGDDMTTDHISPAGWIDPKSRAGRWLIERGGDPRDLNVYAAYRGNWEVMLRGLFTNRLAKNYLADDLPPSFTVLEDGSQLPHFEAAERLAVAGRAVVLLAGERYGMGSSRDWAAKGVALLGVRAVIARSFERIHRTNLIGMGVLPIVIADGFVPNAAGIGPGDRFHIAAPADVLSPRIEITVERRCPDGTHAQIRCRAAVETLQEAELLRRGGVLPSIVADTLARQEDAR